jgi:acetyl esterase/lipase
MASPEFHALMQALDTTMPDPADPPLVVREKMHAIHPLDYPPEAVVARADTGGVPTGWLHLPGSDPTRLVLMVHGGAFVSTGIPHYLPYLALLSRHVDAHALVHEYSLAPEHRFPLPVEQTVAVYRALLAEGRDPRRIAFVGDSCGGGIALAALLRLRELGIPLPACCVGLSPWFDLEQQGDAALHPRGVDPFVNAAWIRRRGLDYVGPGGDVRDPLASPIHADLRGLPPLHLVAGQVDTTADDSTRLAARAGRDGVAVSLDIVPEMIHGFTGLAAVLPEARAALDRAGEFVRRHIP